MSVQLAELLATQKNVEPHTGSDFLVNPVVWLRLPRLRKLRETQYTYFMLVAERSAHELEKRLLNWCDRRLAANSASVVISTPNHSGIST